MAFETEPKSSAKSVSLQSAQSQPRFRYLSEVDGNAWMIAHGGSHARVALLDGIRGIAIFLVLWVHFVPDIVIPFRALEWLKKTPTAGWTGVDLFFVLSGFLITGILLDTRSSPHFFRNFYGRRFYGFSRADWLRSSIGEQSPDGPIPQLPFADAVGRLGFVDVLKLDCEGAEWDIFSDPSPWTQVRSLVMEYHLWAKRGSNERGLGRQLHELGFVNVSICPSVKGPWGFAFAGKPEVG